MQHSANIASYAAEIAFLAQVEQRTKSPQAPELKADRRLSLRTELKPLGVRLYTISSYCVYHYLAGDQRTYTICLGVAFKQPYNASKYAAVWLDPGWQSCFHFSHLRGLDIIYIEYIIINTCLCCSIAWPRLWPCRYIPRKGCVSNPLCGYIAWPSVIHIVIHIPE